MGAIGAFSNATAALALLVEKLVAVGLELPEEVPPGTVLRCERSGSSLKGLRPSALRQIPADRIILFRQEGLGQEVAKHG